MASSKPAAATFRVQFPLGHTAGELYPPAHSRRPDDLRQIPVTAQDNALIRSISSRAAAPEPPSNSAVAKATREGLLVTPATQKGQEVYGKPREQNNRKESTRQGCFSLILYGLF